MKFLEKSYEVLITDLTSFWHESLDEGALKKRIQVSSVRLFDQL
jgi:hypothetical protein